VKHTIPGRPAGTVIVFDDSRRQQRVVVAIKETIRLMPGIDKAIPNWPMGETPTLTSA
jgi:hypothetical protein